MATRRAAKHTSFLDLEAGLARPYLADWREQADPISKRVGALVDRGDFADAMEVTDRIDMAPSARKHYTAALTFGMAAVLMGAQFAARSRSTGFTNQPAPEIVEQAAQVYAETIGRNMTALYRRRGKELIAREERQVLGEQTGKADGEGVPLSVVRVLSLKATSFVTPFTSFMKGAESFIHIGSSLHTSRMGVWGFQVEAQARGIDWYRVDEVNDVRRCAVCTEMDGKVFPVGPARRRIETQLQAGADDDVDALRAFPWPGQSAADVEQLVKMSPEEIMQKGWDTPPYHPLCRGILRPATAADAPAGLVPVPAPPPALGDPPLGDIEGVEPPTAIDISEVRARPSPRGLRRILDALAASLLFRPDPPDDPDE